MYGILTTHKQYFAFVTPLYTNVYTKVGPTSLLAKEK